MARSRSLVIASLSAALAIGMLGMPASAAAPRLAFVQGWPGRVVDICVGSKEVRSRAAYGDWYQRSVPSGNRVVRFRNAAPGECTGSQIAQKSLSLSPDDDRTLVLTARSPDKVLVFSNAELGKLAPAIGSAFAFRHASDLPGGVTFKVSTDFSPITPVADPVWLKGQQLIGGVPIDGPVALAVTRPDDPKVLAGAVTDFGGAGIVTRVEWYFVGTKRRNLRFVTITRLVDITP